MVALATALSGTAADLLEGGRTAHSVFKVMLNIKNTATYRSGERTKQALIYSIKLSKQQNNTNFWFYIF